MRNTFVVLMITIFFFSGFIVFFEIETCIASGNTIYVDDSGGANYSSIQAAINNASNGDTIYVYSGTYYENILINDDLTLTGHDKSSTIIDGGKNSHVVNVQGTSENYISSSISGFTLRNAGGTGNDCLSLSRVNSGTVSNNIIINSDQSDGIQLDHCSGVTINSNTIQNNAGNGISLTASSSNTVVNENLIQNNQKGIWLYLNSNNNNIYSNTITGNTNCGIHIFSSNSNQIYLNDFTNNGQNAKDQSSNTWSYNSQGNYWDKFKDNYGYPDYYEIPGGDNTDDYPLGYFANEIPAAYIDSISPNPAIQGQTVSFNGHGTDDGTIEGWEWTSNLESGILSSSASFSASSLSVGTHTITFRVKDDTQWSEWTTYENTLVINEQESQNPGDQKPTATIVLPDPTKTNTFTQGYSIEFRGYGTPSTGLILEYSWTSNKDGALPSSLTFTKNDLSVGIHTITFKVRDANGWSDEKTTNAVVIQSSSPPTNNAPVANAGGPYTEFVNSSITFNGSESYDLDDDALNYYWDFDDGSTGEGIIATHTYTNPGEYEVTLTVSDGAETNYATTIATIQENQSNNNETNNGNNQNGGNNPLPGFGLILVLIAIFVIAYARRKK